MDGSSDLKGEALKSDVDSSLKLLLPHKFEVVRGKKDENDFGTILASLRKLCAGDSVHPAVRGMARPLTFKETIQARLDQFEGSGKYVNLLEIWLDSCSAIVTKANSSKFKIVARSDDLLSLPSNFEQSFMSVDYNKIQGVELDSNEDIYHKRLTQDQVVNHKGWLAALEGDKGLLKRYAVACFAQIQHTLQRDEGMSFWFVCDQAQDQLRALRIRGVVQGFGCDSNSLESSVRFVRVRKP